jgi:hypothetical protein
LYGQIVSAVGEKKYLVRFDNGLEQECASNSLRVERMNESLPPDVLPPIFSTEREMRAAEDAVEDAMDQEENDGIVPPESDDEHGNELTEECENEGGGANEETAGQPGMIGQLPDESSVPKDYAAAKQAAKDKIAALLGNEVTVTSRSVGAIVWKVVALVDPDDVIPESIPGKQYGMKNFDVGRHKRSEVFANLFLLLSFLDWRSKVEKMNFAILASKAKTRQFTESEFLTGLGILIGAAEFAQRGCDLFSVKDSGEEDEKWPTLCGEPHFEKYMSFYRWKEFKRFFPAINKDESRKESDPWYELSAAVDEFNSIRRSKIVGSRWISVDETMCSWRPRKTALGGLPNISFIIRKPEPLGGFI